MTALRPPRQRAAWSTHDDAALLERIVGMPSVTGAEAGVVGVLQEQARRDGLLVIEDGVGNFIAEAGTGPVQILFVGHVDTVDGHIPVRVEDRALWGRGSVDAKGPLVAAYCAARRFVESHEATVRVVGAVDEEGHSAGAKALPLSPPPQAVIVGEPSGVHGITLAYKGIVRAAFEVTGPRRHGGHPGPTTVESALAFWDDVRTTLCLEDRFESLQGHLESLTTRSDGLRQRVEGRFQVRVPPGTSSVVVDERLRDVALRHGVGLTVDERMEPAQASKRTPLVAAFLAAIRAAGGEPRLLHKTGTADFNHLHARLPDVPIVAYGPGDSSLDHAPDERLPLADFHAAVAILDDVFRRLAANPALRRNPGLAADGADFADASSRESAQSAKSAARSGSGREPAELG